MYISIMPKLLSYPGDKVKEIIEKLPPEFLDVLMTKELYIFGGFLRDVVAGLPYNDIDMIMSSNTRLLFEGDYKKYGLTQFDFEEHAGSHYEKFSNLEGRVFWLYRGKIGQVDVDFVSVPIYVHAKETPKQAVMWAVQQVDLVCCGLLYSYPRNTIVELVPGAYADAKNRVLRVAENAGMYSEERTGERVKKLIKRGWSLA